MRHPLRFRSCVSRISARPDARPKRKARLLHHSTRSPRLASWRTRAVIGSGGRRALCPRAVGRRGCALVKCPLEITPDRVAGAGLADRPRSQHLGVSLAKAVRSGQAFARLFRLRNYERPRPRPRPSATRLPQNALQVACGKPSRSRPRHIRRESFHRSRPPDPAGNGDHAADKVGRHSEITRASAHPWAHVFWQRSGSNSTIATSASLTGSLS